MTAHRRRRRPTPQERTLMIEQKARGMDYREPINGLVELAALQRLYDLAAAVPKKHRIVEIGSFSGQSTCWLAAGAKAGKGARVLAIDPWADPPGTKWKKAMRAVSGERVYQEYLRQTQMSGVGDQIDTFRGFSFDHPYDDDDAPIGLLFVDGDHTYEGVKADWEKFGQYIPEGGVAAFHDYGMPKLGVKKYVTEVVEPSRKWSKKDVMVWQWRPEERGMWVGQIAKTPKPKPEPDVDEAARAILSS